MEMKGNKKRKRSNTKDRKIKRRKRERKGGRRGRYTAGGVYLEEGEAVVALGAAG
jgi:hypothetical protein